MEPVQLQGKGNFVQFLLVLLLATAFLSLNLMYWNRDNTLYLLVGIIFLAMFLVILRIYLRGVLRHVYFDMRQLDFRGDGEHITVMIPQIDEFFYIAQIDETKVRKLEKPMEYQIIFGNNRYRIDLQNFDNEQIIRLNLMLEEALGERFSTEERFIRKKKTPEWMQQREFIQLDTISDSLD